MLIFHIFSLLGLVAFTLSWLSYDHYRPWVNFHAEMLALGGLALLLVTFFGAGKAKVALPRMGLWIGLIVFVPWLQYLTGISFFAGDALMASMYLSALLGAVLIGHASMEETAVGQPKLQLALLGCIFLAALTSAGIGLFQWLGLGHLLGMYITQTDLGSRALGNLGQPNQLATLLLMGMAVLCFMHQQKVIGSFGWGLAIGFMTLVLAMTGSRAGMLSVLVLTVYLMWKARREKLGLSWRVVLVWAGFYVLANLLVYSLAELLMLGGGRDMAALTRGSDRLVMWGQMLYGIKAEPWVGYGWNQTSTAQMVGALSLPGPIPTDFAHNLVLDLLVWNGVPLGLVITGVLAWWFLSRIGRVQGARGVYAMAGLLPLAVHSMVEYPFAYAYFLIAAGFLAGMVEACVPDRQTVSLNRVVCFGALATWILLGSYVVYEYFLIEEDFRIVRFENLRVGRTPEEYKVPQVWMLSHMATMLDAARMRPTPGMRPEQMEKLRLAAKRFPYGPLSMRHAFALGLNGNPAAATIEFQVIRGVYGENYYQAVKAALRELQMEKYPQLAAVETP